MGFRNKRTGQSISSDMRELTEDFHQIVTVLAPAEAEEKLQELAADSFEKEQFQDGTGQKKWKSRKDEDAATPRRKRRGLLVKTGEGKRSIDSFTNKNIAGIGTDLEYMEVHNEGKRAGRGKGFIMPQRQIISKPGEENPALTDHIEDFLKEEGDKKFK